MLSFFLYAFILRDRHRDSRRRGIADLALACDLLGTNGDRSIYDLRDTFNQAG